MTGFCQDVVSLGFLIGMTLTMERRRVGAHLKGHGALDYVQAKVVTGQLSLGIIHSSGEEFPSHGPVFLFHFLYDHISDRGWLTSHIFE